MTDKEQKDIFSTNLKKYLELSGKTQRELAIALGVSPQVVNSWVLGISLPRMGKIEILAKYFNIRNVDLINKSDNIESKYDLSVAQLLNEIKNNRELREFILSYNALSKEQRTIVANLVDSMNH